MSNLGRAKFKTIDQLMEWVIDKRITIPPISIYYFLEFEDYIQIRELLMSKDNKPSVHDIGIISEINRDYTDESDVSKEWYSIATDILKLYRDRK